MKVGKSGEEIKKKSESAKAKMRGFAGLKLNNFFRKNVYRRIFTFHRFQKEIGCAL
jgi:hypothetical protein